MPYAGSGFAEADRIDGDVAFRWVLPEDDNAPLGSAAGQEPELELGGFPLTGRKRDLDADVLGGPLAPIGEVDQQVVGATCLSDFP